MNFSLYSATLNFFIVVTIIVVTVVIYAVSIIANIDRPMITAMIHWTDLSVCACVCSAKMEAYIYTLIL